MPSVAPSDTASLAEQLCTAGRSACLQGNLAEAEALLRQALVADPTASAASIDLGAVLAAQNRHQEAIGCYQQALSLTPDSVPAHFNLANSLRSLGQLTEALQQYDRALALDPALIPARIHRAVTLRDLGEGAAAKAAIRQALTEAPASAEAWHYYGEIYQAAGEFETAIAAYQRELSLVPAEPRTLNLLASSCQCLERFEDALAWYRQALAIDPGHLPTLNNFGTALQEAGRTGEAIDLLQQLLALAPDHADAHWNLALSLLKQGDYPAGWEELEWRWRKNLPVQLRPCPVPLWDGSALAGRTILLQGEQGFGDTFQFIRYAPLVAALGGRVVVECQHPALKGVIAGMAGVTAVIDRDEPLPPCDCRIPLLSLPRVFGTTLATIPAQVPYLRPAPEKVEKWRRLLAQDQRFRVGLVWNGRQELQRNRKRSCTLADLAPLAGLSGVTWYSLQLGPGREQATAPPAGMTLVDLTERLHDFAETAAFIANLDLVITIDTAVAHLAGALGRPVWTMLPASADWRWLLERQDSPWYPTMRLFRQQLAGEWHGVAKQLAIALARSLRRDNAPEVELLVTKGGEALGRGDPAGAIRLFRQALALAPATATLDNNLAVALQSAGQDQEAELCFRAALRLNPSYDLACYNLGFLLDESARYVEAEAIYRQGLAINPANAGIHFNRSHLLLRAGNFDEGLRKNEWRWESPGFGNPWPALPTPVWDGGPLSGKTILICLEQGFGDALQFIRYARLLANRGGRVLVMAPAPLLPLLASADGVTAALSTEGPLPPHDLHVSLMSLPLLCGTTLATIPAQVPYLCAPPEAITVWGQRLPQDGTLRVGLVWQGSTRNPRDRQRSLPPAALAPLARIAGLTFYSLQLNQTTAQPLPGLTLVDLTPLISNFADTAALIANLDLVISVDTAVAHLAGALGKPVWTLHSLVPDWRWFLERDDSPWYPTMRLFRQQEAGNWPEVIDRVAAALAAEVRSHRRPEEALFPEGERLHRAGHFEEAAKLLRQLLASHPGHLAATLYRGDALYRLGRFAEALAGYDVALAGHPASGELHNNRGNALLALGRYEEAIACYRKTLELMPGFAEPHVTIGTALQALGKPQAALAEYRQALAIEPDLAEAHWNLALALLLLDDYAQGWPEYEWRWRKRGFTSPRREFSQPLWDGSPLAGRTILLHGEQGFGDTLQFVRYAPLVAAAGGRVLVECHPGLVRLLHGVAGVEAVFPFGAPLPPFCVQAPLMSLAGIFRTTLTTIPHQVPYLAPQAGLGALWQQRMREEPGLQVGLAWAGRAYPDPNRSCPPAALAPLAQVAGVTFYSLQIGAEPEQLALPTGLTIRDLTAKIADFADTAALAANLDLVISIDTAVAHLAGALGRPTWLLLPFAPDWRWGLARDDSPWYPTMRLFRQSEPDSWPEVIDRVAKALREYVAHERLEAALQRHEAGDLGAAQGAYDQILADSPHLPRAAYLRGTLALQQGEPTEAERFLRQAVADDPGQSEFHNQLGLALLRQEKLAEAEAQLDAALALDPTNMPAWLNRGVINRLQNRLDAARSCFLEAVALAPDNPKGYQNLGVVAQCQGDLAAAHAAFDQALTIAPDYGTARWNLALLQLLQGDYRQGFAGFEARFTKGEPVERRHREIPRWDGSQPLQGQRLLVHGEQGFGDTLQFARYLPCLSAQGATVYFECQGPELTALIAGMTGVSMVFPRGEPVPPCTLQTPLLSLPALCDTTLESIPASIPYLFADRERCRFWQELLAPDPKFKVGVVWWGRSRPDPNRSIRLSELTPLAAIGRISLYSLQVGAGSEQLADASPAMAIQDLAPLLHDFADTAAAIAALDLVVSIDSAVAHLAGAMGKPTWLLLPFAPDWRWGLGREDCPWYPTMRLFRQERPGAWGPPVQRLAGELATFILPKD